MNEKDPGISIITPQNDSVDDLVIGVGVDECVCVGCTNSRNIILLLLVFYK